MKHWLLFILCGWYGLAFGQNNAPFAENDTLFYHYFETHANDSIKITAYDLLPNDSDPDGDAIEWDDVWYNGSLTYVIGTSQNTVINIRIAIPDYYYGNDTLYYVLRDNGSPVMRDTAMVIFQVQRRPYEFLETSSIKVVIDKDGLFKSNDEAIGFNAPKNSEAGTFYAANLWVGAADGIGSPSINIRTYGDSSIVEDQGSNCGPVSNTTYSGGVPTGKWERVWKITKAQVDSHMLYYSDPNYVVNTALLDWPAHGDTANGEAFSIAPYEDFNMNGIYDPENGDYPLIKGDESVYFIYNDGGSGISSIPLKTEVRGMAYTFHCEDSALSNTVFVDYEINSFRDDTLGNTYIGMFSEMDIGNPFDDYTGCDVERSLYYMYNGDDVDNSASGGDYGTHPPAQGVMFLQGVQMDKDQQDNPFGIGTNQSINGNGYGDGLKDNEFWGMSYYTSFANTGVTSMPSSPLGYYMSLRGNWEDGTPHVYGGNGHTSSGGNTFARFMFPGYSDSTFHFGTQGTVMPEWSEFSESNLPYDGRGMGSTGPYTIFPNKVMRISVAFVFGRDYDYPGAVAGLNKMLAYSDTIRAYYEEGLLNACSQVSSVAEKVNQENKLLVYPNPFNDGFTVKSNSTEEVHLRIYDVSGKIIFEKWSRDLSINVSLNNLPPGVYFLNMRGAEISETIKLIKN